jgi:hypothetical protein
MSIIVVQSMQFGLVYMVEKDVCLDPTAHLT